MVLRRLDVVRVFWEEVEGSSAGFGALDVLDNGFKVVRGKTPRTISLPWTYQIILSGEITMYSALI